MDPTTSELPPQAVMMQMINGKLTSRCISLMADLGIADLLEEGPRDAGSLARETETDSDALYRVLRMLAGLGIFAERDDGSFENTPLSETLRTDGPGSVRFYASWLGTELHWEIASDLEHSLRTGESAIWKRHPGRDAFEVLAERPDAQRKFNQAMTGLSVADGAAIAEAYDFTPFERVVDVGGGHGGLAELIARQAPDAAVTVVDLPHVIEGTDARFRESDVSARLSTRPGSFFEEIGVPADLVVLKHIIHDWDDEKATLILGRCRETLNEGGRIAVCEMVVTDGPESVPARILDIEMLMGPGGRERTRVEFSELFRAAGLRLERVVPTRTPIRILEAIPERRPAP